MKRKYIVRVGGVEINHDTINMCIDKFNEIKNIGVSSAVLVVLCEQILEKVDFMMIGHFILFKKAMPALSILMKFNCEFNEYDNYLKSRSILWKLRQTMVHAYCAINENVFEIEDVYGKIYAANSHDDSWFVLSKKILPIIYIDEEKYKEVFVDSLSLTDVCDIGYEVDINIMSEEEISASLKKRIQKSKKNNNYVNVLGELSFFGALHNAKLLKSYHLKKEKIHLYEFLENISNRLGYVKDKDRIKSYERRVMGVFDDLMNKSPIYSLIFYVLTSSELISTKLKNENIDDISKRLVDLWGFTEDLVYGLDELAKNIIQHASDKKGIIGGYLNEDAELRIKVFDHSINGVIDTLKENTKEMMFKSGEKNLYREDVDILSRKDFKYEYLFVANDNYLLNHQTKRSTAHLGLLIFSKLIMENKGCFYSYTRNKDGLGLYIENDVDGNSCNIGTGFEVKLPLKYEKSRNYRRIKEPIDQGLIDKICVEQLLDYEHVNIEDEGLFKNNMNKNDAIYRIEITDPKENDREYEKVLWEHVKNKLSGMGHLEMYKNRLFICFDFNKVKRINASQLFRFLGKFEIEYSSIEVIISNIKTELYMELVKVNKSFLLYKNDLLFWNKDTATIVYSYEKIRDDDRFYFVDVLWGYDEDEFSYINALVKKNNYNALYCSGFIREYEQNNNYTIYSKAFYNGVTMLPLDLLIIGNNGNSVFENNSITILKNPIKSREEISDDVQIGDISLKNYVLRLQGFKISNTHFRLGSKIHIRDFYYAKRLFQNSYYSSRFGFVIAKEIIKTYLLSYRDKKSSYKLTVLGYGIYSEFLLSMTIGFINDYALRHDISLDINHNIYDDAAELRLVKGYEEIYKNIFIVIPIATTLSTSMKIEKEIKKNDIKHNILGHINAIIVNNSSFENMSTVDKNRIEYKYGWRKVCRDQRIIKVASYHNIDYLVNQKYILSVPSEWYSINECKICFPGYNDKHRCGESCFFCENKNKKDDKCPLNEKPLLVTDKTSVTPEMVFDFPIGKDICETNKFKISNNSLGYGHLVRNDNHYHYHIFDEVFYKDNEDVVDSWLKTSVLPKIRMTPGERLYDVNSALIIAPKHFSNAVFVNKVNQILFKNSGNILHYDFRSHNVANFQLFYEDIIKGAKLIVFVDDAVITGSTYFMAKEYIEVVRAGRKGFDACLFLVNRTNRYVQEKIKNSIADKKMFFSFSELDLPALRDDNSLCKLCVDLKRANNLLKESFLERLRIYYAERILRLKMIDLATYESKNVRGSYGNKKYDNDYKNIMKVEAIHRIFQYFKDEQARKNFINIKWDEFVDDFIKKTNTPFNVSYLSNDLDKSRISNISAILLKVLSLTPFDKYMPIRKKIFNWTIYHINEYMEYVRNVKSFEIDYWDLRDLKFLIRRVGIVRSNFLISEKFLFFIAQLYDRGSLERVIKNTNEMVDVKDAESTVYQFST